MSRWCCLIRDRSICSESGASCGGNVNAAHQRLTGSNFPAFSRFVLGFIGGLNGLEWVFALFVALWIGPERFIDTLTVVAEIGRYDRVEGER